MLYVVQYNFSHMVELWENYSGILEHNYATGVAYLFVIVNCPKAWSFKYHLSSVLAVLFIL